MKHTFTRYQVFVIAVIAILQFTVILDFMVLSPLGDILMTKLTMSTAQFGLVVSAYAFSAAISGILAAGFADKYDRKKLLLFFYAGFTIGTVLCALATDYYTLLFARIVTGIFGGVMGSIGFAIITDLFKMEVRGRVMGFVQMAFSVSQVLGLPISLELERIFNWHAPFWMIAAFCVLLGGIIAIYLKPVTQHLGVKKDHSALQHLVKTFSNREYLLAFAATTLLATGGFMLMPFGSAFSIHNLGLKQEQLKIVYGVTGVFTMIFGPLTGMLSDRVGKYKVFFAGSVLSMVVIAYYTQLGITPLWTVIAISTFMFIGVSARMISSSALVSGIPAMQDRGAFMSINASVQQAAGGVGAIIGGLIVFRPEHGPVEHYQTLGFVVIGTTIISMIMMYLVDVRVEKKLKSAPAAPYASQPAPEAVVEH
jgi:predicted MFS family arabinose efflux permease